MTAGNERHDGKVHVVGVGEDGIGSLTASARQRVDEADVLLGTQRLLDWVPPGRAERVIIGANLGDIVRRIEKDAPSKRVVVLASGDPLFYGTARYLCERLGKDFFVVEPHVSSMQLAFARVKESWEEAYLTNVDQRPLETIIDRIRVAEKVGLFTSSDIPPARIARALLDEGIDYFHAYVCENLGARDEVITQGTLGDIAEMDFGPLNVMILVRTPNVPERQLRRGSLRLFGNPDETFKLSRPKRGLSTPAEVRSLALAELELQPASIVWDIGAGSGSVSIEAARLAPEGKAYAIETDEEDCQLIRDNAQHFGVANVEVVQGRAPDVFGQLPTPDAVFIGGTGRETAGIVTAAFERLRPGGRLVVNVASLENVSRATGALKPLVDHLGLLMVSLSRGVSQLDSIRFESLNPSFLISVGKRDPAVNAPNR